MYEVLSCRQKTGWKTKKDKVTECCCCSPSETYGRKWGDSNFQAAGVVGTF